jgi:dihydropteridine reductase
MCLRVVFSQMCLQPAVDAAHFASLFLEPRSSLVLTGAAAALGPTPGMIGYGLMKASTHYLVRSLAGLNANGEAVAEVG